MNSYALCLTEEMMESFSRLYSDNGSIHLTRPQRAMLFTSMVVQPESLMLKVIASSVTVYCRRYAGRSVSVPR